MANKEELILKKAREVASKARASFNDDFFDNKTDEPIFVLVYLLFIANKTGRFNWSEELVNRILELRYFDDEDDETFLKNRFNLFNRVLSEGKVRADWKHGVQPDNQFDAVLYLLGDLMLDASYYEDYENCPVIGMDINEKADFANKLETGLFPLIIEFATMLK